MTLSIEDIEAFGERLMANDVCLGQLEDFTLQVAAQGDDLTRRLALVVLDFIRGLLPEAMSAAVSLLWTSALMDAERSKAGCDCGGH